MSLTKQPIQLDLVDSPLREVLACHGTLLQVDKTAGGDAFSRSLISRHSRPHCVWQAQPSCCAVVRYETE